MKLRRPRNKDEIVYPKCCTIVMQLDKGKETFSCDHCGRIVQRMMPLTVSEKQLRNKRRNKRQEHERMLRNKST